MAVIVYDITSACRSSSGGISVGVGVGVVWGSGLLAVIIVVRLRRPVIVLEHCEMDRERACGAGE